ncbi:MAG: GNAT family N-acetyltransferase [Verrucomicrobiae bacterium]|nr:GNAT family N-acetyltransferase [Verrucomicrobiae bacterium]
MTPTDPQESNAVVLEGRHVRLEPLSEAHHAGLCVIGMDPGLWEYVPYQVSNPVEMLDYIRTALREQAAGVSLPFAIVDRASGTVAGSTRFMNMDRSHRRVEVGGTWLGEAWRRTALNTEAKYLLFRHAFESLGCVRVELKADARNQRSRTAILRIGAKEEGTLRRHMILWNSWIRDTVYYSVLDSEWPAVKAGLEARMAARR